MHRSVPARFRAVSLPYAANAPLGRRSLLKSAVLLSAAGALSGCSMFSGGPRPSTIVWSLKAEPGVNPDVTDRPSPIWVRIYQLRSIGVFGGAQFQPLFDGDIDVLGAEMLQRSEYVLTPNQSIDPQPKPVNLHQDTRYIGVIAAYHEIDRAFWRDSVEVKPVDEDYTLKIGLDRLALRLDLQK
jgi:type VI secretion system protein VasD